eukprot:TRINITY_DN2401_c0_g1_i7.p1 TRINITY_DN2401_c0_g1~~TRINITY_DN2401_c0_g1_i7.p1  ORF type:complete len:181 (-),score=35.01 TRINITY_DN2401_c0_g1_i7:101-643(-)
MFEDVVARNGFVARRKMSRVEGETKRMKRNSDEKENVKETVNEPKEEMQIIPQDPPKTSPEIKEVAPIGTELKLPPIKFAPFKKLPHVGELKRVRIDGEKYRDFDAGTMIVSAFVEIAKAETEELAEFYRDFPEFLEVTRFTIDVWDQELQGVLRTFERQVLFLISHLTSRESLDRKGSA